MTAISPKINVLPGDRQPLEKLYYGNIHLQQHLSTFYRQGLDSVV